MLVIHRYFTPYRITGHEMSIISGQGKMCDLTSFSLFLPIRFWFSSLLANVLRARKQRSDSKMQACMETRTLRLSSGVRQSVSRYQCVTFWCEIGRFTCFLLGTVFMYVLSSKTVSLFLILIFKIVLKCSKTEAKLSDAYLI